MSPTEKAKQTLNRILDSAETLFARQGYEGTSTRQISSAAGISIQTLHYHCESKLNLYLMVIRRAVLPMVERIQSHVLKMDTPGALDPQAMEGLIHGAIEDVFDLLHANPNYAHLYFRQYMEQNPDLMQVEFEAYVPFFRQWVQKGQEILDSNRGFQPDLPLVLMSLAWTFHGLFVNSQFVGALVDMDSGQDAYLKRLKTHAKSMTTRMLGLSVKQD